MITIANVSIPHNIFINIYDFTNKEDYGTVASVCKGWFEAFVFFKQNSSNLFPRKIIEKTDNLLDSTGMKTILQWEKAIKAKQLRDYENLCKLDPEFQKQTEERAVNLVKAVFPIALEATEKFNKAKEEKSEDSPKVLIDTLLDGIFNNFSALNEVLEPNAHPFDKELVDMNKKVVDISKNMISDVMHTMMEPQNLFKMLEGFKQGIQHVDADTPMGDIIDHTARPVFEMMHPILAKHFEAIGCPINENDHQKMLEELKKSLNQEYGTLKEYLRKTQALDDMLDNALVEMFGSSGNLALVNTSSTLSTYVVDLSNPKNDYEKCLALVTSAIPKEMTSEIQPILSKLVSTMYAAAGCQTPEEFQERTEKLRELQKKADEKLGRLELLKQRREQLIAILMAQPNFDPQNLIKVNKLFDQIEQNPEVEKSSGSIYAKAMQHQFKLMSSMLKIENLEENFNEVGGDVFDPLITSKSSHLMVQKLMLQMEIYWKEVTQNITDPDLQLQYDVAGLEMQAIFPSGFRCQLHEKYERDLSSIDSTNLLTDGKSNEKIQVNPIKLSEFDRLIGKQFLSHNDLKNMVDVLRSLPDNNDETMVNKLVQKSQDDHRSFLAVFNNQDVKIEEVNE